MRVIFDFIGREMGALGDTAHYCETVDAPTYADAARQLYEKYEHVCPLRSWTASVAGLTLAHGTDWDSYPKEG